MRVSRGIQINTTLLACLSIQARIIVSLRELVSAERASTPMNRDIYLFVAKPGHPRDIACYSHSSPSSDQMRKKARYILTNANTNLIFLLFFAITLYFSSFSVHY